MSKYRLININTGQETLCDSIEIDGIEYYVNNEKVNIDDLSVDIYANLLVKCTNENYGSNAYDFFKKIIATNRRGINLPKIISESEKIEILANKHTSHLTFAGERREGIIYGYNLAKETYSLSVADMVEFYEWCNYPIYRAAGELGFRKRVNAQYPEYDSYVIIDERGLSIHPKGIFLTIEQVIELWMKGRPKILYYE